VKPAGAFYLFPDISDLLSPDGIRTSAEFAQALLHEKHVALTAGEAFDAPGFVRISYATSLDRLLLQLYPSALAGAAAWAAAAGPVEEGPVSLRI